MQRTLTALLGLCLTGAVAAQGLDGELFTARTYLTGREIAVLDSGDFDEDGQLDLVAALNPFDEVVILRSDGLGGLLAGDETDIDQRPEGLAVGDLDDDGHLDVLVVGQNPPQLTVLRGDGLGGLAFHGNWGLPFFPVDVALGDLDGDGDLDVVTANRSDHSLSVLLGDGAGGLAFRDGVELFGGPSVVELVDLTGDGQLDLVVSNDVSNEVAVLPGDGQGGFGEPTRYPTGSPGALLVLDVNDDGHLDLLVANRFQGSVSVLAGYGEGRLTPGVRKGAPTRPAALAATDLNGDGLVDIVVGGDSTGVMMGVGGCHFAEVELHELASPAGVVVHDWDDDGLLDLALGSVGLRLHRAVDALSFPMPSGMDTPAIQGPGEIVLGDWNGDGYVDMATTHQIADRLSVQLGRHEAPLVTAQVFEIPDGNPLGLDAGDLDEDGRTDLLTANEESADLSLFTGDGLGGFGLTGSHALAHEEPSFVRLADLDDDGHLDAAVLHKDAGRLTLLMGDGAGGFTETWTGSGGQDPACVAIGDLDLDGHLDLAVAGESFASRVNLWWGDADASYARTESLEAGLNGGDPTWVVLADLAVDGGLDVVSASRGRDAVAVMDGDGRGNFAEATEYFTGDDRPECLVVADLGGDDALDLLVCHSAGTTLGYFEGDGRGGFAPVRSYPARDALRLGLAELDHDGAPDVVLIDRITGSSWFRNPAGGEPDPPPTGFPLTFAEELPLFGEVGAFLLLDLEPAGGDPPYTVSVSGGELPAGLTLDPAGVVSGVPTEKGKHAVSFQVVDQRGGSAVTDWMVRMKPALEVRTMSLKPARHGRPFKQQLKARRGDKLRNWILGCGLPEGFLLNLFTGRLTGTPEAEGTWRVDLLLVDALGAVIPLTYDLEVLGTLLIRSKKLVDLDPGPDELLRVRMKKARLDKKFLHKLRARGGIKPYTWSVAEGELPAGLQLDPETGRISGAASEVGVFDLVFGLEDDSGVTRESETHRLEVE